MKKELNYPKKNDTLIYALGGLGEVGKNMTCFEHDDEILIIDCGVMFPGEDLPGVDYVIPDFTTLVNNPKKKILVITHGHEDHIGSIPFLLKSVKIDAFYAPKFAIGLINKKLEERKIIYSREIKVINNTSTVTTKHFKLGFFNTIHSIPDSLGVIINSPNGRIVHTGDFKFDLTPVGANSDYQIMSFLGQVGVDLLLSDSTNSEVSGFSTSEKQVAQKINAIMQKTQGRLIVATFASNVHRVGQILEAAVKNGRKVIVFGRSMENVVEISRKLKTIDIQENNFLKPHELNSHPDEKICIVCTGSQGEPMAALSRIASGTHRHIRLKPTDTVVFSSSPIPGNDGSVNSVVNKLFRSGANVLTKSVFTDLHTTGHASQDEQKLMLQLIKPTYFMPVHGEYRMLKTHANTGIATGVDPDKVIIAGNGDVIIFRNKQAFRSDYKVSGEDIYIDGNDTSGIASSVLKDRAILASGGFVSVVVTLDSRNNEILTRPSIISRGFVFIKDNQTMMKEAEAIVYEELKRTMRKKTTFLEIKNNIKHVLEAFLYKETKRHTIVIPVILNSVEAINQIKQYQENKKKYEKNKK